MGLFGKRKEQGPTVEARVLVVPGTTANVGSGEDGNSNNLSIDARVKTSTTVRVSWVAHGQPIDAAAQRHVARVRNWVRIVLDEAGGVGTISDRLPREIHLPAMVDAATQRVVAIDWDRAEAELAAFRDVARDWWKVTEAPLADLRNLRELPSTAKAAAKGVRETLSSMRRGAADMVADLRAKPGPDGKPVLGKPAWTEAEAEQARRSAVMRRAALERDPKTRDRLRRAMLDAGPRQADAAREGYMHPVDFAHWLMVEETAGVLTADEAAELRRRAGLDGSATTDPITPDAAS